MAGKRICFNVALWHWPWW